uniref:Uncharacterized protein n=1 Tax=Branchiostoma floridae TaxID=7739 RepID=C3ZKA0_BRAFL|eukprot:XP_002590988.1 hypothetical protein BRAFLDRAFT_69461 [Branchiostoma floridae]
MEDPVAKKANPEDDASCTVVSGESCDLQAEGPTAESAEIPTDPHGLCNTFDPDHNVVLSRNPTYFSATDSSYASLPASLRNEQNQNQNPMYAPRSADDEPRSLQDDDNSNGSTAPVRVTLKTANCEGDACTQPQVVAYEENNQTVTSPSHSECDDNCSTLHQEDDSLACRLTANGDGDTYSIQPYAVRYGGNDGDGCSQSYAVRYGGNDGDGCSQPYAVRYGGNDGDGCSQSHDVRIRYRGNGEDDSIQPYAVRYGGNDGNDCSQSHDVQYDNDDSIQPYAVQYKGNDDDGCNQPYAVRYEGTDNGDCSQPCTVRLGEDGSNGNNMPSNNGAAASNGQTVDITNADADIQPYAVAYMGQDGTAVVQPNEETEAAQNSGDAIPSPGRSDRNSAAKDVPHPLGMQDNPMYAPNQRKGCKLCPDYRFPGAVISGWACVGVYFSTGFKSDNKLPQSATDTTYTRGHPEVNTTVTVNIGLPAIDTTYIPDDLASHATYTTGQSTGEATYTTGQSTGEATYTPSQSDGDGTYTPSQSDGDGTYTTGQSAVDGTYTPSPVQMPSTESPKGGNVDARVIIFGGEGSERGKFKGSFGVAVSADGEVFVADRENQRIQVFNMNGAFLRDFPVFVFLSPRESRRMFPCDVIIAQNEHLMVLGTDRLDDPEYAYLVDHGKDRPRRAISVHIPRSTSSLQSRCSAISVRRREDVASASRTAIIQLLPGGKKDELTDSQLASALSGDILVTDNGLSVVRVGRNLFKFGKPLGAPHGDCTVGLGRRARIIVADAESGRLDMLTSRGSSHRIAGNIEYPWGVALGPQGQLVVTNPRNNTVTIFDLRA